MNFIEAAHAAGSTASGLLHRAEAAPTIVLILMAVIGLAAVVLGVMWLFLPLAVYGLKKRMDEQTAAIEALREELVRMQAPPTPRSTAKLSLPEDEREFRL